MEYLCNLTKRSHEGSGLAIMQAMKSVRPFLSICLKCSCPNTALLGWKSAEKHVPAENSSIVSNGRDVKKQNREALFCTTTHTHTHYLKSKVQEPHFPVQHTRPLPMERFAGTHKLSEDTPYLI